MNKKVIGIASVAGAVILGCGAFIAGAAMNNPNIVDEGSAPEVKLLTELKVGKYYLVDGTKDEYIEVYDDNTLQVFGLDYFQRVLNMPQNRYIASLSESEYAVIAAEHQEQTDFWKSRNYYWLSTYGKTIDLDTEPPEPGQLAGKGGHFLSYIDENTIVYADQLIYKFVG